MNYTCDVFEHKTGKQLEMRTYAGEADIVVIFSTTGKITKTSSGRKYVPPSSEIDVAISMNGSAYFTNKDLEFFLQMIEEGKKQIVELILGK